MRSLVSFDIQELARNRLSDVLHDERYPGHCTGKPNEEGAPKRIRNIFHRLGKYRRSSFNAGEIRAALMIAPATFHPANFGAPGFRTNGLVLIMARSSAPRSHRGSRTQDGDQDG